MTNEATAPTENAEAENKITLELLNAVHSDAQASQRSLAGELGIALGLTNAYLKRCVRKGLVKVAHTPANRYAYYLTPKGFSEKSRLTAGYLKRSFNFYREARSQCEEALNLCDKRGHKRLILVGAGELAEIALLCTLQHVVKIVGIVDAKSGKDQLLGVPGVASLAEAPEFDAVLITDLKKPQRAFEEVSNDVPLASVLTPPLLNVSRDSQPEATS